MNKSQFSPVVLTIAALLGACSSMPTSTSLLDQTRSDYAMAQDNPRVATYAPLEMKQAGDALELANAAASRNDSNEQIDKLAYLARQKIALTQEVGKQRAAEADVASAGQQRDQMLLQQRTIEADQARSTAEDAKLLARMAEENAAESQRQAEIAQARTAALEAQLLDLAAMTSERGLIITLGDVLFGTDQAHLTADGMRTVQKLADILQQNPQRSVLVEGFTDSTGSTAHNLDLSEQRAGAVRDALQQMGIPGNRIDTRGYGETYPVAANDTGEHRQLNRRVEIILSSGSGGISQR